MLGTPLNTGVVMEKILPMIQKVNLKIAFWASNLSLVDFLKEVNTEISTKSRDFYQYRK